MWTVAAKYLDKGPSPAELGYSLSTTLFTPTDVGPSWATLTFRSSWGLFGYMNVPLPDGLYAILGLASLLAVASAAWQALRRRTTGIVSPALLLSFFLCSAVALLLMGWTSYVNDWQPQGRYHFPAILAEAFILLVGWGSLGPTPRWRDALLAAAVSGTAAVNVYSFCFVLWPLYR